MKKIILILSSILLLASCEKHYYDPVVQIKEYEGQIPQEGDVIMIDYVYEPVETKFTAPTACLTFRYRAFIDDDIYSYALVVGGSYPPLKIVVPCNDTFSERNIKVEISAGKTYDRYPEEWGEWQEVFSATQACLASGESQTTTELADKKIIVTKGDVSIQLETPDNGSIMPLKVLLSKGELTFDVNVYEALISSVIESDDDRILKNYVPLNHGSEYQSKAVYMNDRGQIIIHNDFTDGDSSPLTLIGTPAKGDIDQFQSMFTGNEKQMLALSLQ